jgi:hypothetical protein
MFDDACCEHAGQAIVQFASSTQNSHQYALKFFIAPEDYQAEASVYRNPDLRTLLPRLEACIENEDGVLVDHSGQNLPPCIIMERGESLDEWCHRQQPDMSAAVVVRSPFINVGIASQVSHGNHCKKANTEPDKQIT